MQVLAKMVPLQAPLSLRGSAGSVLEAPGAGDVGPGDMGTENTLQKGEAQRMWNSQHLKASAQGSVFSTQM